MSKEEFWPIQYPLVHGVANKLLAVVEELQEPQDEDAGAPPCLCGANNVDVVHGRTAGQTGQKGREKNRFKEETSSSYNL